MVLQNIPAQSVHAAAPALVNDRDGLSLQVLPAQTALFRQRMHERHHDLDGLARKLQCLAAAVERHHALIEHACDNIDVVAEMAQDLPRVFPRVLERHQLELDFRAHLLQLGPEVKQEIHRRGWRTAEAYGMTGLLHGCVCTRDGILAVLNEIFGIPVKGFPRLGQLEPAVRALEEPQRERSLEQIDLLDHGRRRDEKLLCRFIETPGICHFEEGIQLGIVYVDDNPFLVITIRLSLSFCGWIYNVSATK